MFGRKNKDDESKAKEKIDDLEKQVAAMAQKLTQMEMAGPERKQFEQTFQPGPSPPVATNWPSPNAYGPMHPNPHMASPQYPAQQFNAPYPLHMQNQVYSGPPVGMLVPPQQPIMPIFSGGVVPPQQQPKMSQNHQTGRQENRFKRDDGPPRNMGDRNMNRGGRSHNDKNFNNARRNDKNSGNDKERPLFLDTEGQKNNRSKSQPRFSKNNSDENNSTNTGNSRTEGQAQNRGGYNRGGCNRGGFRGRGRPFNRPYNEDGGAHHVDRRTNFKKNNKPHQNQRQSEKNDSEPSSQSESESNDESSQPKPILRKEENVKSQKPLEKNMPDVLKPATKPARNDKTKNKKKNKKPGNKDEEVILSKDNLGPDDLLMKFIGTSIPTLVDAICLNVDLTTKVKNVVMMSDTEVKNPQLVIPKTLMDIINFKLQNPNAKSMLM